MATVMERGQRTGEAAHARRWWTLATLCLSLLIIVMDNTILNVAIPSLMDDLHATNSQIQWIIDGYTLVFAGLLLTSGSLGDRFGRKGALQLGIVLFGMGSIASAMAGSAEQLILTRAFMGIGGALIMPATLSILTDVFRDPRERGRAIAIWAGFSGLGVALGPVAGGLLLKHFSWSSVFWVNLPIGLTALIAARSSSRRRRTRAHPASTYPARPCRSSGWAHCCSASSRARAVVGPTRWCLPAFAVGLTVLAAFIAWELNTDHPMLDMRFFRNPRFSVANGAITLTFFAMFGSLFLMTQYWQLVHGYTPLGAGVRLIPFALTMMVVAPLSARVVEKVGTKRVVSGGLLVMTTSLVLLSFIQRDTSYSLVIAIFCLMAVGMGLTMAPATESIMGSLPREKAGVGSAVNDTTRQVGGALGVAIIGSIVSSAYASRIATSVPGFGVVGDAVTTAQQSLANALRLAPGTDNPQGYVDAVRDAFVHSLSLGLRFSAVVVLIAAVLAWRFLPARAVGHHFTPAEAMTSETVGARAAEEAADADDVDDARLDTSAPVAID